MVLLLLIFRARARRSEPSRWNFIFLFIIIDKFKDPEASILKYNMKKN